MATEMVNLATSEKLKEMDWMRNIEICELVSRDPGQAKDVIKSIKKRLKNKNANTQLFAVMLLEMLMNNCGEHIHRQVFDNGLLPILVKIVKKKTDLPVRERIFLLLDATQTALGGASGKFPQYYNAYYELVAAGVQFPQQPHANAPIAPTSESQEKLLPAPESALQTHENGVKQVNAQPILDSSIIHKAHSVLEVLRDVLNAVDPKRPEGAAEEFVLDLVEQCSFQKQRVMHLVMTSRDEKVITGAIELNEQIDKVLAQHDYLLSVHATATTTSSVDEEAGEEEDAEYLYRRIRKGKACAEDLSEDSICSFRSIPADKLRRPLIRPLSIHSSDSDHKPSDPDSKQPPLVSLPPPPARHMEREKFFKEKNVDGADLAGHIRGLSLDSRNGSSSQSGSTDCSERDIFGFRD
ncbi:TOM1-like protein 2 [Canna indica]|uniref:TOM1-like protein 2 n=1 Tax=Canna indica TaxID=4628 RepID=A0AAQ3JRP0_9LILI|nr:TOM1-like protein 2 [Canna indica]